MHEREVPILIVGGGPVGLSASLLLSRHGVPSMLVERHPGTSLHPKARGLNVRTLELFRVWGLEPTVRAAAKDLDRALDVVLTPTILSPETKRLPYGGADERQQAGSPASSVGCAQDKLEPVCWRLPDPPGSANWPSVRNLSPSTGTRTAWRRRSSIA